MKVAGNGAAAPRGDRPDSAAKLQTTALTDKTKAQAFPYGTYLYTSFSGSWFPLVKSSEIPGVRVNFRARIRHRPVTLIWPKTKTRRGKTAGSQIVAAGNLGSEGARKRRAGTTRANARAYFCHVRFLWRFAFKRFRRLCLFIFRRRFFFRLPMVLNSERSRCGAAAALSS